jgi:hypothetical protein
MATITYHVPVGDQDQAHLMATVERLFATDPKITQRATGTTNINWQDLDSLADLLDAEIEYSPFVTFTIGDPGFFTQEQQIFLDQPGIDIYREHNPLDVFDF